jgi:SAM-dependent methyltransferase
MNWFFKNNSVLQTLHSRRITEQVEEMCSAVFFGVFLHIHVDCFAYSFRRVVSVKNKLSLAQGFAYEEATGDNISRPRTGIGGKHFLGLEHLHYGYWPQELDVNINNLRAAQENYTNFLLSQIPAGVRTILDVGCGSGHTSKRLVEKGYEVACVSPSPVLSAKVRELMGNACRIFECKYEDLQTDDKFDLVLFSESFQYMKIHLSLKKTLEILNPDGFLLICDVFRNDMEQDQKAVGGGHLLSRFYSQAAQNSFEQVKDIDMTGRTMPNMDLMDDTMKNVVRPIVDSTINFLGGRYPFMSRVLQWLYRRRINKVYQKYFNGRRASADFVKFKSYRLLLYKNVCSVPAEYREQDEPYIGSRAAGSAVQPAGV